MRVWSADVTGLGDRLDGVVERLIEPDANLRFVARQHPHGAALRADG